MRTSCAAQTIKQPLLMNTFLLQERWPAGDYPLQSTGGQGLAKWTQQDRAVGPGQDPVVWYCFGVTHIPRCALCCASPDEVSDVCEQRCNQVHNNRPATGSVLRGAHVLSCCVSAA